MSLAELERAAYARTGQAEAYEDTAALVDTIDRSILPEPQGMNVYAIHTARETLWNMGDTAVRRFMAIGSVAVKCWPGAGYHPARRRLLFDAPWELNNYAQMTHSGKLAVSSVVAVGEQYQSDMGYVSGRFVPWAATVSNLATDPQLKQLSEVVGAVKFSDHHTDSEEMGAAHDVSDFLKNTALPLSFRQRLLQVALVDARNTDYKPHVWQARMNVTLRGLAGDKDNSLRFMARQELGLPLRDRDYAVHIDSLRNQKAQALSEKHGEFEQELDLQRNIVRTTITSILRRSQRLTLNGVL